MERLPLDSGCSGPTAVKDGEGLACLGCLNVGPEVSIWDFKLMAGGDHNMLLRIFSRLQLSKADAASERLSDGLGVMDGGNGRVGEVSGGVVNTGGIS